MTDKDSYQAQSAPSRTQLTLDFEGGISRRYRSLLELVAAGTYRHGLQRVANAMDQAPSNLSMMLSGQRHFPLDRLEAWIEETGDVSPVYYLVEKYLRRPATDRDQALARVDTLMEELQRAVLEARK